MFGICEDAGVTYSLNHVLIRFVDVYMYMYGLYSSMDVHCLSSTLWHSSLNN